MCTIMLYFALFPRFDLPLPTFLVLVVFLALVLALLFRGLLFRVFPAFRFRGFVVLVVFFDFVAFLAFGFAFLAFGFLGVRGLEIGVAGSIGAGAGM